MKAAPVLSQTLGDCPQELRKDGVYVVSEANHLLFVDLSNVAADALVARLPDRGGCRVSRVQGAILAGLLSPLLLPIAFTTRLPNKRHVETTLLPMQRRLIAFASGSGSGDLLKSVLHATSIIKDTVQELCNTPRDPFSAWVGIRPWFQRKCVCVQTDASFSPAMISAMESADHILTFVHKLCTKKSSSLLPKNAKHVVVLHTESADERLYELMEQIRGLPPVERPTVVMFGSANFSGPSTRSGSVPRNIWRQLLGVVPQECNVTMDTPDISFIPEVGMQYWLSDTAMRCNNPNIIQCPGPISVEYVREVFAAAMVCNPYSSRNIVLLFEDEGAGRVWQRKYLKSTNEKIYLWNCAAQRLQQRNRRRAELLCVDGRCWLGLPPHTADTTVIVCSGNIPPTHLAAVVARTEEVCWIVSEK